MEIENCVAEAGEGWSLAGWGLAADSLTEKG